MHAMGALAVIDPKANLATIAGRARGRVGADRACAIGRRTCWATSTAPRRRRSSGNPAECSRAAPVGDRRGTGARREGADALLKAIAAGKASARLLQERSVTIILESSGLPGVTERIAALLKGLPPADPKLAALYARRRDGFHEPRPIRPRGPGLREALRGLPSNGGKGARVGPQLDGIGSRGLDRLMEDILDPNRNVDQTFRVTNLALKNGQIVSGLLLREEGEVLILADSQGKEVRVPKSSVEDRIDLAAVADAGQPDRSDRRGRFLPADGVFALETRSRGSATGAGSSRRAAGTAYVWGPRITLSYPPP